MIHQINQTMAAVHSNHALSILGDFLKKRKEKKERKKRQLFTFEDTFGYQIAQQNGHQLIISSNKPSQREIYL